MLNSQIFKVFCEEMGSQYTHLLLHAEVKWLSKGKILTRVFVLCEKIKLFFQQKNNLKFQELLSDNEWAAKVAYMKYVFSLLNGLSISLQEQLEGVFTV